MLVLSILERQILCEPGWKMPGLHLKIFFSPFLSNNIQTHFLSYFFYIIFHSPYFTFNQTQSMGIGNLSYVLYGMLIYGK